MYEKEIKYEENKAFDIGFAFTEMFCRFFVWLMIATSGVFSTMVTDNVIAVLLIFVFWSLKPVIMILIKYKKEFK